MPNTTPDSLRVTLCTSETRPEEIETINSTWEELAEGFESITETDCHPCPGKKCNAKRGLCWMPVAFDKRYRTDENVVAITLAVFDLDHISLTDLEAVLERVKAHRYIVHSTHNHTPPDDCATRLILAISRPVSPAEWRILWPSLIASLGIPADPTCKNPSRLFYAPSVPRGCATFYRRAEGVPVDVDALLKAVRPPQVVTDIARPDLLEDPPVEISGLRGLLVTVERTKARSKHKDVLKQSQEKALADMLARIRQGLPIAVAGDHKGDTDLPAGRDHALNRAFACLAFNLPKGTPWEAVAEIMRETIYAMANPEGVAHWMSEAKDMYKRAVRRREGVDAANERSNSVMKKALARLRKGGLAVQDESEVTKPTADDVDAEADDPDAWRSYLDRDDKGNIRSIGSNVVKILMFHPDVGGFFRWNDVTRDIEISGGIFEASDSAVLDVNVSDWLGQEFGIQMSTAEVGKRILAVARDHKFDPIRDYLRSLDWDGVPRIDTWLEVYCQASTENDAGKDITELVRRVGRNCLMGLAARALTPGCKVDDVMVLEGAQGIRKSTALKILGGEWYISDSFKLGEKDSKMLAARAWVLELAELASLRKTSAEAVKAFISLDTDTLRPPYGSRHETFPRRCVFIGTTNPDGSGEYLIDRTGNRRYRPIRCLGQVDVDSLKRDRDQLFAEAVCRVEQGDRYWFDASENDEMEEDVTSFRTVVVGSSKIERISAWWANLKPQPHEVYMSDVIGGAFPDLKGRESENDEMSIGRAMHDAGFKKRRRMVDGKRHYYYEAVSVQKFGPGIKVPTLTAVAGSKAK